MDIHYTTLGGRAYSRQPKDADAVLLVPTEIASSALGFGWTNPRSRVGVTFASRKV